MTMMAPSLLSPTKQGHRVSRGESNRTPFGDFQLAFCAIAMLADQARHTSRVPMPCKMVIWSVLWRALHSMRT